MTDGTVFETRSTWGKEGDTLQLEIDPNVASGLDRRQPASCSTRAARWRASTSASAASPSARNKDGRVRRGSGRWRPRASSSGPFRADDVDAQAAMMARSPTVMRHLGGQRCRARRAGASCSAAPGYGPVRLRLLGGRAAGRRRDDRPARLRRLQARHDALDRGPSRNGLAVRRRSGGAGLCDRGRAGGARLDRRGAERRARSSRSSTPDNAASIRVAEKCGFAQREPARYSGEPILLFRRRARLSRADASVGLARRSRHCAAVWQTRR